MQKKKLPCVQTNIIFYVPQVPQLKPTLREERKRKKIK